MLPMIRPKQASDRASRGCVRDGRCFTARFCLRRPRLSTLGVAVAQAALLCVGSAQAADDPFKATAGYYRMGESGSGVDLNLRHSSDYGNVWLGFFRAPKLDAQQWRGGWDRSFGETVRVQPSAQLASGGFVGGSLNIEAGSTWVAGAGFGRTNLRPYYNLNFDPNDAWSLLAAYRGDDGLSVTASYVRDNRQNPDQQHFHLTVRSQVFGSDRLTGDLLYKRGMVEGKRIARAGATVTYDWPRYFVRLAYDPYSNFSVDNVWRLSVGLRF